MTGRHSTPRCELPCRATGVRKKSRRSKLQIAKFEHPISNSEFRGMEPLRLGDAESYFRRYKGTIYTFRPSRYARDRQLNRGSG